MVWQLFSPRLFSPSKQLVSFLVTRRGAGFAFLSNSDNVSMFVGPLCSELISFSMYLMSKWKTLMHPSLSTESMKFFFPDTLGIFPIGTYCSLGMKTGGMAKFLIEIIFIPSEQVVNFLATRCGAGFGFLSNNDKVSMFVRPPCSELILFPMSWKTSKKNFIAFVSEHRGYGNKSALAHEVSSQVVVIPMLLSYILLSLFVFSFRASN